MSIQGNLETMPLPDILQFVGLGRKTGVLCLDGGLRRKQLFFEEGMAVFCSSGDAKEHLGQHLLARTSLTEEELTGALRLQEETGQRLGEVLVARGLLSEKDLTTVLAQKIADSMYELFTWESGAFEFLEGPLDEARIAVRVPIGWQDLVMEGARRADEMSRIRSAIPGTHVRLEARPERFPPGFPKSSGDRKLVELVGQGLAVREILPRFHASDFDVLHRLAALVGKGLLGVDDASLESGGAASSAEVLARAGELAQQDKLGDALEVISAALRDGATDPALAEARVDLGRRLRRRFEEAPAGLAAIPRLAVALDALATSDLDSRQAFVATRLGEQWDLQAIMQVCPFDEADVLATVDRLVQRRLVELSVPVGAPG